MLWIRTISDREATYSLVASSAYGLVTKQLRDTDENLDLSRWSVAGMTNERSEPRRPSMRSRMPPDDSDSIRAAFKPAYGMCEIGAISAVPLG